MTIDEQIASIRNGQYPCGCQAVGAVALLLAELDAARQHNEALATVLAQHNDFGALFQPGGRFYNEANLTLGSSAVMAGGAWLVEQLDAASAREAKLREAATTLRVDANRLCDRNLGGTYEEDCRRSIAALDAALAEGEDTRG